MTQLGLDTLPLPKKFAFFALSVLVYLIPIFLVHPARDNISLLLISQSLLYFLALFYFIPVIKTWKKGVMYCVFIPFFCCMITSATHDIVTRLVDGKLPYYLEHFGSIKNIILIPYIFLWIVTIPLLITYCFYLYLSRHAGHYPEKKGALSPYPLQEAAFKIRLFQHKGVTLAALIVYSAYAILHYCLLKWQWKDYGAGIFFSAIPVCLLSFLSFFYLAHVVVGKVIKSIVYCLAFPLFWSTIIYVIYAVTVFIYPLIYARPISHFYIYIGNTGFPLGSFFSIKFFLTNYIVIHAWFISVSLLLMCGIYYYFAKSECSIKTSNMRV